MYRQDGIRYSTLLAMDEEKHKKVAYQTYEYRGARITKFQFGWLVEWPDGNTGDPRNSLTQCKMDIDYILDKQK